MLSHIVESGRGKCPFSPREPFTARLTGTSHSVCTLCTECPHTHTHTHTHTEVDVLNHILSFSNNRILVVVTLMLCSGQSHRCLAAHHPSSCGVCGPLH